MPKQEADFTDGDGAHVEIALVCFEPANDLVVGLRLGGLTLKTSVSTRSFMRARCLLEPR